MWLAQDSLAQDSAVAAVERFWTELRGQALMLSARDVELVERWEAAGVSAEAICRALARGVEAFRAREGVDAKLPSSLGYFRATVEAEVAVHRPAAAADSAPIAQPQAEPSLEERLAALPDEERAALEAEVDRALAPEKKRLGVRGLSDRRQALLAEALRRGTP